MISFLISWFYFFDVSSIKTIDKVDENICKILENNEIEYARNVNMGIMGHTYIFDKIKFYKSNLKPVFIEYLDKSRSQVTDRPAMMHISIIYYKILNVNVIKTEVEKILHFIASFENYKEYPIRSNALYKIGITKMDLEIEKKNLFKNLPDLHNRNQLPSEKLNHNVFNIFLLENISNNNELIEVLRKQIETFFYINIKGTKSYVMMKITIIETIFTEENNVVVDLFSRLRNNTILLAPLMNINFVTFGFIEDTTSCFHTNSELCYQRDIYSSPYVLNPSIYNNIKTSLFLYEKSDENNFEYNIKFFTDDIGLLIWKYIDTNNTYTKLLNFLGHLPLERSFGINMIIKSEIQNSFFFKITVLIHREIIKEESNPFKEKYKNIKQIIVSIVDNDNNSNMLINYSHEMNTHCSDGFPLSNIERESIQEKEYYENSEAKKLINFIDFYESFIFGRYYFYFKNKYYENLDLSKTFCFYRREIWFKSLDIDQISKILANSYNFAEDVDFRNKSKIIKIVKSIKVYEFERDYTKKLKLNNSNDDFDVLKAFENHHFFDIELRFYNNISSVKYCNTINNYLNLNSFIKIDLGFNKNYFIFFREVPNNRTNTMRFFNMININNEAKLFLTPIIKELLCLDDDKKAETYSLNFISVIFRAIKTHLHINVSIEFILCHNLRNHLHLFLPEISRLVACFLQCNYSIRNQITTVQDIKLMQILLNTCVFIVKRNFQNNFYEACILRSLSNVSDNSQEILESLL